jgi:glycosyltransferase involved in cell wall biosynthesis
MPLISVIIPAFNAETSILETVATVRGQTFHDLEILVIDDGSTDDTLSRLTGVRDDRLRPPPETTPAALTRWAPRG